MDRFLVVGFGGAGKRELSLMLGMEPACLMAVWNTGHTAPVLPEGVREVHNEQEALAFCPELVFIATPTSTHLKYAEMFLGTAKAILIDKPMDADLEKCEAFCQKSQGCGTKVYLNYQRRYLPCWQKLRSLLQEKDTGEFLYGRVAISSYYPSWRPGKRPQDLYVSRRDLGGGVLLTECHELDLIGWLLGPVVSVSARSNTKGGDNSVEDQAMLLLDLALPYGKRSVSMVLDDHNRIPVRLTELCFENMCFRVDEVQGTLAVHGDEEASYDVPETASPHGALLKAVLGCVEHGKEDAALPGPKDGLAVNSIVHAAKMDIASSAHYPVAANWLPKEKAERLRRAYSRYQTALDALKTEMEGCG